MQFSTKGYAATLALVFLATSVSAVSHSLSEAEQSHFAVRRRAGAPDGCVTQESPSQCSDFLSKLKCCPGLSCQPFIGCFPSPRQHGNPCLVTYGEPCIGDKCCDESKGLECVENAKYASIPNALVGECVCKDPSKGCSLDKVSPKVTIITTPGTNSNLDKELVKQDDGDGDGDAYVGPTYEPTDGPTKGPTPSPTKKPTRAPTKAPTKRPTSSPTKKPTRMPIPSPPTLPYAKAGTFGMPCVSNNAKFKCCNNDISECGAGYDCCDAFRSMCVNTKTLSKQQIRNLQCKRPDPALTRKPTRAPTTLPVDSPTMRGPTSPQWWAGKPIFDEELSKEEPNNDSPPGDGPDDKPEDDSNVDKPNDNSNGDKPNDNSDVDTPDDEEEYDVVDTPKQEDQDDNDEKDDEASPEEPTTPGNDQELELFNEKANDLQQQITYLKNQIDIHESTLANTEKNDAKVKKLEDQLDNFEIQLADLEAQIFQMEEAINNDLQEEVVDEVDDTTPTTPVAEPVAEPKEEPVAKPVEELAACGNGNVGNGICQDANLCCSSSGWCGDGPEWCNDAAEPVAEPVAPPVAPPAAAPVALPVSEPTPLNIVGEPCVENANTNTNYKCCNNGLSECGEGYDCCDAFRNTCVNTENLNSFQLKTLKCKVNPGPGAVMPGGDTLVAAVQVQETSSATGILSSGTFSKTIVTIAVVICSYALA